MLIVAKNDVTIIAAPTTRSEDGSKLNKGWGIDLVGASSSAAGIPGGYSSRDTSTTQKDTVKHKGTTLDASNVVVTAGNNLSFTGSTIVSQQDTTLAAGNNLLIGTVQDSSQNTKDTSRNGFDTLQSTMVKGNSQNVENGRADIGSNIISHGNFNAVAGNNLWVKGSSITAAQNMNIAAVNDVNILPGEKSADAKNSSRTFSLGSDYTVEENKASAFSGFRYKDENNEMTERAPVGSSLNAGNNLNIQAGKNINLVGADVQAKQNMNLNAGNDLNILAMDHTRNTQTDSFNFASGALAEASQSFTGAIRAVAQEAPKAYKNLQDAHGVDEVASRASDLINAASNIKTLMSPPNVEWKVGGTISYNTASANSESLKATGSHLQAGGNMFLSAGRDISIEGANITASGDMALKAVRDLNILPSTATEKGDNSSSGANFFAGFGGSVGASGVAPIGFRVDAGVQFGDSSNQGTIYTNSHLTAGKELSVTTGRDATIHAGNLSGNTVSMDIGRNLSLVSVKNEISSSGYEFGGKLGLTFGAGVSASVSDMQLTGSGGELGLGLSNSNNGLVTEQASIHGKNGVNIYVGGNTHLTGSVIAAGNDKLILNTGSLTFENIHSTASSINAKGALTYSKNYAAEAKKVQDAFNAQQKKDVQDSLAPDKLDSPDADSGKKPESSNWYGSIKEFPVKPGDLALATSNTEQNLYATVGNGNIIIRNNPNQDLSELNRDVNNAYTVTTDSMKLQIKAPFTLVDNIVSAVGTGMDIVEASSVQGQSGGEVLVAGWVNAFRPEEEKKAIKASIAALGDANQLGVSTARAKAIKDELGKRPLNKDKLAYLQAQEKEVKIEQSLQAIICSSSDLI